MTPRPRKRTRLAADDRRRQLLDVAAELLLEGGFRELNMEGVARRAGVSKGLGYAYFENADALALELYDREVSELYGRVEAAVARASDFEARIRAGVTEYLDVVAERGALIGVLEARMQGRWFARAGRRRVGHFLAFWAKQIESDLGVAPDAAAALAAAKVSAVDACARAGRRRKLPRARIEELCVRFAQGGLREAALA
ncbi:MAG TPA: helix-turn-helix domain-containing protein [Myxococcota bacterium]|nr:helix-turn-helix domain-containing protein [Myxococcota bacterium]